jgi:hypothetical protein
MGISLELVQGTARDFPFQVTNPDGTTPTGIFLSTDVLTASVWAGSNETPLLTPTATWISATNAQYQVTFQDTDSAGLAIGQYYLQALATRIGSPTRSTALLPRGTSLEILAAPGTSFTPRPTYIVLNDVKKIAPWINDLQVPDDNSGFDDQLADSRDWLDELILRNYRGGNVSLLGYHGFALDAWYTGGGRRTALTNHWLFTALQTNQLLVTPRVKQLLAYFALSKICESMITKSGQYVALASRFRFEAESLLCSTTVEIDVNGDGWGEVPINFSSTNTLWA